MTISNKVWDVETGEVTDCHREGINGRCGLECPVLLAGYCENEEEVYNTGPDNRSPAVEAADGSKSPAETRCQSRQVHLGSGRMYFANKEMRL